MGRIGTLDDEKKLYVIMDAKVIPTMDGIHGPVSTPTYMRTVNVVALVKKGYTIYEVNPLNHNERVRVTRSNAYHIKFKDSSYVEAIKQKNLNAELQDEGNKSKNDNKNDKKKYKEKKEEVEVKSEAPSEEPEKINHTDFMVNKKS